MESLWINTQSVPKFPKLEKNLDADVCVVGAGIAGLSTAYLLMKEGKSVCVLEDSEIGSGQTGRSTAQFVTALDDRYFKIERIHGLKNAKLAAQSHVAAISKVRQIIQEELIDCDMESIPGYLFAHDDPRTDILDREFEAIKRIELQGVEELETVPLSFFNSGPCLRFPDQLQLNPVKYLNALSKCIIDDGGKIFTQTRVVRVEGGEDAFVITNDGFIVHCKDIVVATNAPINDLFAIHTKQAAYRTYVVSFKIPPGSVEKGLYWDTLDPYHYIRLQKSPEPNADIPYEILIVGGEDHKTGQEDNPSACFDRLITWTRNRFPMAGLLVAQWSGQVMEPADGLAFLGHNPMDKDNVYVITGDSGNGMTHCTIGALIITDQILGHENPWKKLYSPSRVSLKATPTFLRENANVAAQYGEWFTSHPKPDFSELKADEGIVYRDGTKMIAAYKEGDGDVRLMSASCPHLGGIVHWNSVEKSWDCPCHGSRFDCKGRVIEGPAFTDLKELDTPQLSAYRKALDSDSFEVCQT